MAMFTYSKNLKPAKRYAKALLEFASEALTVDKIYEELGFILSVINENPELKSFLSAPPVSKGDKKDVLARLFGGRINNAVLDFLFLLNENSRLEILEDIYCALKNYTDEEKNILNATVISAIELTDAQKTALKNNLQNKTRKMINPEYTVDKEILGGLIIKINDTVIDLSLMKKIENLRK